MMAHLSTACLFSCLFTVVVLISTALGRPSIQDDIDIVQNNLTIKVIVETSHLSTATYKIVYILKNTNTRPILNTDDWEIIFSLHSRDLLTKPRFEAAGFAIEHYKENLYKMFPVPNSSWRGLPSGSPFKITIIAKGLSVFRSDMFPNFIIRSPNTIPRVIASTADESLSFVKLAKVSNDDYSHMTGVQRTVMTPEVVDMDRVPHTIVIPAPLNITISPEVPLLEMSAIRQFHVFHESTVSDTFKAYFENVFTTIPNMDRSKLRNVTSAPQGNVDRIYIQQTPPQQGKSEDYYELAVRPKTLTRNFHTIHMSATSEAGLHNAVESLMAAAGLYDILPDMTVIDDARFGHRALSLDLTKNFFPITTIKKLLKVMSTYKLNKLELNLGGDHGWRYQIMDFPELTSYASKRCGDESLCLPPNLGADSTAQLPSSGFYTLQDLANILTYAYSLHVDIIPRFNILGGMLAAKKASQKRYDDLIRRNPQQAEKFHLTSAVPTIPTSTIPEDELSVDGLLDPCRDQTFTFINALISEVNRAYSYAGVPFKNFHAGGDGLTQFLGKFPSCKKYNMNTFAKALSTMIGSMQVTLSSVNATLHVNEEGIVDPEKNDCIVIPPASKMSQSNLVAHFYKTFPGSPEDWNLSTEQLAYMDGEVVDPPSPMNPNGTYDALLPYNGIKKGFTSWIFPYRCANKGFKIVLKPENYFALDQAYELDFNETGNRDMRQFHIINMHRMMMYEPLNHYINMDLGKDGYTFLQYRMCKLHPCETLIKKENVLGLAATLDTTVIRTEEQLFHMLLPRLFVFAEKAWRQGEHENILRAEDPSTLVVEENLAHRAGAISMEIDNLMNNIAFKEFGRLDDAGYPYRVPTLGASIQFGIAFFRAPPFPVMIKSEIPRQEVYYRDLNGNASDWQPLFSVDQASGRIVGGYAFTFPNSTQKIEVRAMSAGRRDGTGKRPGRATLVEGTMDYYLPRNIPIDLREGTCLPIEDAWLTDIANVTELQWRRIQQNINAVLAERRNFMRQREIALEGAVDDFRRATRTRANINLPMVFEEIRQSLEAGENITSYPSPNIIKDVYLKDQAIHNQRERQLDARYRTWQQIYLQCKAGAARVELLPDAPVEIGQLNPGLVPPMGGQGQGQGRQASGIGTPGGMQMGSMGVGAAGRGQGVGQGMGQGVGQGRGQGMGQGRGQGVGQGRGQGMGQGRGQGQVRMRGQSRGMGAGR